MSPSVWSNARGLPLWENKEDNALERYWYPVLGKLLLGVLKALSRQPLKKQKERKKPRTGLRPCTENKTVRSSHTQPSSKIQESWKIPGIYLGMNCYWKCKTMWWYPFSCPKKPSKEKLSSLISDWLVSDKNKQFIRNLLECNPRGPIDNKYRLLLIITPKLIFRVPSFCFLLKPLTWQMPGCVRIGRCFNPSPNAIYFLQI